MKLEIASNVADRSEEDRKKTRKNTEKRETENAPWKQRHQIVACAPAVREGKVGRPLRWIRVAPFAHHVPDIAAGRVQSAPHLRVNDLRVCARRLIARVVLEEIDSPLGVRLGVLLFVAERASALLAGASARVRVCGGYTRSGKESIVV